MQVLPSINSPLEVIEKEAPVPADWVIVWRVFDRCTLACRFCGFSREVARPRLAVDVSQVLALGKVLADLQQRLGCKILLSWLGGEPLDWDELPALSRPFRHEFGLSLGVTTNGLPLIRPRVRRDLLADYEQVTVSIDGLASFHDYVRQCAGLWEHLRRGVELLRRDDERLALWRRVNTVLMRGNIGQFVPFCREMNSWGFHELTFNQLGGNDRPEFYPANRLLLEQLRQFRQNLRMLQQSQTPGAMVIRGVQSYLQRIEASTVNRPVAIEDCAPGRRFLFIGPTGRISPCSFTNEAYGVPVSEIDSVEAFLRLADRFDALRRQKRSLACEDCHATHVFDKFACADVGRSRASSNNAGFTHIMADAWHRPT
jgi:MoaA/NifB/PqqE/SkfB family radical SAM enzyme